MPSSLAERIVSIQNSLPPSVKLIAVSKYTSVEAIRVAYEAGIRNFGESKVQAAKQKQQELIDLTDITWHMIGHLQSNKAKLALQCFDWIHSVDRLSLAQQLNRLVAEMAIKSPSICLQIRPTEDPNKHGWYEHELIDNLPALRDCSHLNIVGLMTILPLGLSEQQSYTLFLQTANLANKLRSQGWDHLQELSMGMSEDYHLAVQAGATLVRIGSAIFAET